MTDALPSLPYLTHATPGIGGRLRARPEDFRVEEIAAYEPSGTGDHLFALIEKRGLTTPQAVEQLARALGANPRDVGSAGMKDKHAVTVQTLSFPASVGVDKLEAVAVEGVTVKRVVRHGNKLRTGHLRGNRFVLRVTGLEQSENAFQNSVAIASQLRQEGVPNFYGSQRFGRDGDNEEKARRWLVEGGSAPRDPMLRKLLPSALQSVVFNRWLTERMADGLLGRYVEGDLATRMGPTGEGRPWAIDPAEAEAMYAGGDVSPTGPMPGPKMMKPTGEEAAREARVMEALGLTVDHFARAGELAQGTRRIARIFPEGLSVEAEGDVLVVSFVLPPGAYATTVMREFMKDEGGGA